MVAGATATASHPICRVCAGLGHLHHPFTAELVDRFVEEHPSLTKGQVAYAHAAAKFEVLRAADLEVDERCDNPGGGVERGSQIVIHQWLGEGSEERVHLARKRGRIGARKAYRELRVRVRCFVGRENILLSLIAGGDIICIGRSIVHSAGA